MPLRWVRAAILAVVAGFVGLSGHVYAGGLLPSAWILGLVYIVSVAACAGLLGRPASALRILLLTVVGQFATHLALSVTGGHLNQPAVSLNEIGVASLSEEFQAILLDALGEHGLMTFVHLLASILVGLWLAVGEQTLWGLLSLIRASLSLILSRNWFDALHLPVLRLLPTEWIASATQLAAIDGSISRRGPPAYTLAA